MILGSALFYGDWPPILQAAGRILSLPHLGAAMIVLFKDLRERPAALLQPKAPKPGKRIFLEYITPLWSRLSFNQKSVTEISSDISQECLWRLSELLDVPG